MTDVFSDSDIYFPTEIQKFQFFDKYSRYNYALGRRETWVETVDRATDFLHELAGDRLPREDYEEIRNAILNMEVMPSMRLLATAGPAARRNNISIYNCSFLPIRDIECFGEALMISMSGCGVGFSVERKNVDQLPTIAHQRDDYSPIIVIEDSTEGWQEALNEALYFWFVGVDPLIDYSNLRPAGTPLSIKGGYASGPEPFRKALKAIRSIILSRQGQKLRPIDAHDIMCHVGSAAVSGGVRRTAMISLFDLDDQEMLSSKTGDFSETNSQRWNANNSVVINNSITQEEFNSIFNQMVKEGNGEPGLFNRESSIRNAPTRRSRRGLENAGTNPCGEIVLRPYQFCNLSIAVGRSYDTYDTLHRKVRIATKIGAIQSLATKFPGLREDWKKNAEEERLLGVDITGQMDCPIIQNPLVMKQLKNDAILEAHTISNKLGINMPASITTVKPAGNSAQLLDVSSGVHPRWSSYYIRRVRISRDSAIYKTLLASGFNMVPEVGQDADNATTFVASFPIASPTNSTVRHDVNALDQCRYWKRSKINWTEHNPSVTITYKPEEVKDLKAWIWKNISIIGGMSFLPTFDAKYDLLPYEEIDENTYETLSKALPKIEWSYLPHFETKDETTSSQELACFAGSCELDTLG